MHLGSRFCYYIYWFNNVARLFMLKKSFFSFSDECKDANHCSLCWTGLCIFYDACNRLKLQLTWSSNGRKFYSHIHMNDEDKMTNCSRIHWTWIIDQRLQFHIIGFESKTCNLLLCDETLNFNGQSKGWLYFIRSFKAATVVENWQCSFKNYCWLQSGQSWKFGTHVHCSNIYVDLGRKVLTF